MERKPGTVLILLGVFLILAAVMLTLWNRSQARRAGESAENAVGHLQRILEPRELPARETQPLSSDSLVLPERSEREYPDFLLNPRMEMPVETIDGRDYIGVLKIPALELELPVISQWSYPALQVAPARYDGSAYLDNLVIAAHNYDSHFGRIHSLCQGDRLTFTDMDGNVFVYEAEAVEILRPADVEEMRGGDWDLTLFTCTLGGKFRVAVRCSRVEA